MARHTAKSHKIRKVEILVIQIQIFIGKKVQKKNEKMVLVSIVFISLV